MNLPQKAVCQLGSFRIHDGAFALLYVHFQYLVQIEVASEYPSRERNDDLRSHDHEVSVENRNIFTVSKQPTKNSIRKANGIQQFSNWVLSA